MPVPVRRWLPLALVAFAALWLRTHDLAARPMHSDEANQAVKCGELLESGRYAFDPRDHHGPVLYYAALPIAWLRGQRTLAALDETTVRLVPAIAGTVSVVLLFVLALPLGFWAALAAAAFLAVSPPAVYYSRYFVQETMLVTFTVAAAVSGRAWWKTRTPGWAIATGLFAGLMQATKASAPIFIVAALCSLFVVPASAGIRFGSTDAGANMRRLGLVRDLALALAAALAIAALFYSSFGTHVAGVSDAIATYRLTAARLAGGLTGHEKPWWYFLTLFGWQRNGGLVFEQVGFTALALTGGIVVLGRSLLAGDSTRASFPSPASRLLQWAAVYTVLVAVLISFPAYKTPWHALHLIPGLALLAAGALHAIVFLPFSPSPRLPGVALAKPGLPIFLSAACAVIALTFLTRQTHLAAFLRPADARNPYAYVHSAPDVLKFRALADAALARTPNRPVRVISAEYWPLPWYFRGLAQVGYWTTPPVDCDGALVIASIENADTVRSRLAGKYGESILGLRPGFLCVVFTPSP